MPRKIYEFEHYRFDLWDEYLIDKNGDKIKLAEKGRLLLRILIENAGKCLSYNEIITEIWGNQVNVNSYRNNLQNLVCNLKKIFGNDSPKIIQSITNGYKFIAKVKKINDLPSISQKNVHITDEIVIHQTLEQVFDTTGLYIPNASLNNSEKLKKMPEHRIFSFSENRSLVFGIMAFIMIGAGLWYLFNSGQISSSSESKIKILSAIVHLDFSKWSDEQDKVTIKYTYKIKKLTDLKYFTLKIGTESEKAPEILNSNFSHTIEPIQTEGMCNPKIKYAWLRYFDISQKAKDDEFYITFESTVYGSFPHLDAQTYNRYMYNEMDAIEIKMTFPEGYLPKENEIDLSKAKNCKDTLKKVDKNKNNFSYDFTSRSVTFTMEHTRTDELYEIRWKREKT